MKSFIVILFLMLVCDNHYMLLQFTRVNKTILMGIWWLLILSFCTQCVSAEELLSYEVLATQSAQKVHVVGFSLDNVRLALTTHKALTPLSSMVDDDVVAMINASFFTRDAVVAGSIKYPGRKLYVSPGPRGVLGWRNTHQGVEVFFDRLRIDKGSVSSDFSDDPWWLNADYIIEGAPLLIAQSQPQSLLLEHLAESFHENAYARSAVCVRRDNTMYWFLVEGVGRFQHSMGLRGGITLRDFTQFLLAFGCVNALNLDGGRSSSMFVQGNYYYGSSYIANKPIINALALYSRAT